MILQSVEELEVDLRSNGFRPVYLVLGPEMYQCRRAISLLKAQALKPESMSFDYAEFSGDGCSVAEVIDSAGTFPMLSKRRLVLVTETDKMPDPSQDDLLDSLKHISPRGMLILAAEELDRRKRFYKTLRDKACVAEFPRLKGAALKRWAAAFFQREGRRISPAAIEQIVDLAGPDLQRLAMELEKMLLYAGNEKNIPDSVVDEIAQGSRQRSIFEFLDAVSARDRAGALKLLANLLETGEPPLRILHMIARHGRQLLIAKEGLLQGIDPGKIASAAQIPAFILDKFIRQARAADAARIRLLFVRLAEMDRQFKSSIGDERTLLEKWICDWV